LRGFGVRPTTAGVGDVVPGAGWNGRMRSIRTPTSGNGASEVTVQPHSFSAGVHTSGR
jgi:hypothetical protein